MVNCQTFQTVSKCSFFKRKNLEEKGLNLGKEKAVFNRDNGHKETALQSDSLRPDK